MEVITYGSYDLFHIGHLRLLRRASKMGKVTVALSTDEFAKEKNKEPVVPYKQRKEILQGCKYVYQVIPETCWEQKKRDVKYFDIMVMGDDWEGAFD